MNPISPPSAADPICPSCEQTIPPDRYELHLEGLDGTRPECPRTDLVEIVKRKREADDFQSRLYWTNPFGGGSSW